MSNDPIEPKVLGLSVTGWITLVQTIGIPGLFMAFFCYFVWSYVPPIVASHVELLKRTGDTLESMDDTLTQSNRMLEQLAKGSYPDLEFRARVFEEHATAQKKIDEIHAVVVGDD
jgi:hypothetical protein